MREQEIVISRKQIIVANAECDWASEMVLNPAIISDGKRIHMLFRATGPWSEKQEKGKPLPFPISLGYAFSEDGGDTWEVDFEKPALFPRLSYELEGIKCTRSDGSSYINYANGCIEDPRLFTIDDECYMTVACRMFPPGPYWIHDDPMQCAPSWAAAGAHGLGRAASENVTVSVLYKVDLKALAARDYLKAFSYVTNLTDPERGENRDVVILPEKITYRGDKSFVSLHRPWDSVEYISDKPNLLPSIIMCCAEKLEDIADEVATQRVLASPLFDWEGDRIGASGQFVKISPNEWLLSYHGKKDAVMGYTQSFLILDSSQGYPLVVKHRCPTRLFFPVESWEMPKKFKTPVLFITGIIELDSERLLVSYGAGDESVGIAYLNTSTLLSHVRQFDSVGKLIK